jgi:hypothetical protein
MANIIKQKRGTTDPAASDLVVGELAINTTDGGVFTKTDGGTVVELGASINLDTSPQLGGNLESNGHDIRLADEDRLKFGADGDLEIFHKSGNNNSLIRENGSGNLVIAADNLVINNRASTETKASFDSDGAVELYYDAVKKFETTTDGVAVTGDIAIGDDDKLKLGDGEDLEIYHDGTETNIVSSTLLNIDTTYLRFRNLDGTKNTATFTHTTGSSGGVQLYYDGNKKFETTNNGIAVTGDIFIGDDDRIKIGDGADLQIFHNLSNGNSTIAESGSGNLNISADNLVIYNSAATETKAKFVTDGAVALYYDNVKKFETTTDGISVTGDIAIGDNDSLYFGDSNDLRISHDGNNSVIRESGSGNLVLAGDNVVDIYNSSISEVRARFFNNGPVELYHNAVKKFETTSTGATITGTCTATEFSGSGASLTGVVKTDATGISGASTVSNIVTISQADYDAISSPDASTIYYITS